MVDDPDEYFLMNPLVVLGFFRVVAISNEPVEFKPFYETSILVQSFKLNSFIKTTGDVQRVEISPIVNVCHVRICYVPILLLLQDSLIFLSPFAFLIFIFIMSLLILKSKIFELFCTQIKIL